MVDINKFSQELVCNFKDRTYSVRYPSANFVIIGRGEILVSVIVHLSTSIKFLDFRN